MFACAITGAVGNAGSVTVNFIYDEARPFEVRIQRAIGDDIVMARDLLREAFWNKDPSGLGIVRVLVSGDNFFVSAVSENSVNTIMFPKQQIAGFIEKTFDLVPFGTEQMDIDALLQDFYDDKI